MHSLPDCHLCVDLVGLFGQLPAFLWNSVSRSDLTREHQTWRLQHEVAVYNPDNLTVMVLIYYILISDSVPNGGLREIH